MEIDAENRRMSEEYDQMRRELTESEEKTEGLEKVYAIKWFLVG